MMKSFADLYRSVLFGADDRAVAKIAAQSATSANCAEQILFEIGLTIGVPLVAAALIGMAFAP